MSYLLNREDAPFKQAVWQHIDVRVVQGAESQLTARRILDVEGPFGLGVKSAPTLDHETAESIEFGGATATVAGARAIPLAFIRTQFYISARDIAAFEQHGVPFDAAPVITAAIAAARQEDTILLNGSKALGTEGLLTAKGTCSYKLKPWTEAGVAASDIMAAATTLDKGGFQGPYALALAPELYNFLHRLYDSGHLTELEHVRQIVTEGVVKAPAIPSGGVLVASGRQFASILLGQDLMAGFVGPGAGEYEFFLSESVALRLRQPGAVCVLTV